MCTSDRGAMFVTSKDLVRSNTIANMYSDEAAFGPVAPRHPDFGKPVGHGLYHLLTDHKTTPMPLVL